MTKERLLKYLTTWDEAFWELEYLIYYAEPGQLKKIEKISDTFNKATKDLKDVLDDKHDILQWHWRVNDMGFKEHELTVEGRAKRIKRTSDLVEFFEYE